MSSKYTLSCTVRLRRGDETQVLKTPVWIPCASDTRVCQPCVLQGLKISLKLSIEGHCHILNQQKLPTSISATWYLWKLSENIQKDRQVLSGTVTCSSSYPNLRYMAVFWIKLWETAAFLGLRQHKRYYCTFKVWKWASQYSSVVETNDIPSSLRIPYAHYGFQIEGDSYSEQHQQL